VTLDKSLVEALEKDYTTAPISPQERAMLDYVVKLTKDATKVWKDDHEACAPPALTIGRFCRLR
jgi:hypothetical protein